MGHAGAGRAQEDDVLAAVQEVEPAEVLDHLLLDRVLEGEATPASSRRPARSCWSVAVRREHFGERLMPLLAEVGIEPGEPELTEFHNVIEL